MKTIFWNVDTQYDFIEEDGALAIEGARSIRPTLAYLTDLALKKNIQVVNTADLHNAYSREISNEPDFVNTFPPHCMQLTKGAEYIPETKPTIPYKIHWEDPEFDINKVLKTRNIIIYKDEFDAFDQNGGPHTAGILGTINPDQAVVYGVATNVCVDYAVMGLLERGVDVYVLTDAIKELPGLPLEQVLNKWETSGATLIKTRGVEDYL